ncbi:MAG: glucosaminidase domain-containing protein [Bryobacterales bacterium]|nr:glucosaminidase domain-containing protein [Bryobacterales bacterium]
MADFRYVTDLQDPRLTHLRILFGKKRQLDLWGGPDLAVSVDGGQVEVTELKVKGLPKDRRRFDLKAKAYGSCKLDAFKGAQRFVNTLQLTVPSAPSKEDFIKNLLAAGKGVAQKYKLPPSIMVAQSILESGAGASDLALLDNILYGITKRKELSKGAEPDWYPAGKRIVLYPTIAIKDQPPVMDRFCAADDYAQAVEIWAQYVTQHPHTKKDQALFKGAPWSDADRQKIAAIMPKLQFGKGSNNYAEELMKTVRENGLAAHD